MIRGKNFLREEKFSFRWKYSSKNETMSGRNQSETPTADVFIPRSGDKFRGKAENFFFFDNTQFSWKENHFRPKKNYHY